MWQIVGLHQSCRDVTLPATINLLFSVLCTVAVVRRKAAAIATRRRPTPSSLTGKSNCFHHNDLRCTRLKGFGYLKPPVVVLVQAVRLKEKEIQRNYYILYINDCLGSRLFWNASWKRHTLSLWKSTGVVALLGFIQRGLKGIHEYLQGGSFVRICMMWTIQKCSVFRKSCNQAPPLSVMSLQQKQIKNPKGRNEIKQIYTN